MVAFTTVSVTQTSVKMRVADREDVIYEPSVCGEVGIPGRGVMPTGGLLWNVETIRPN